MAASIRFPQGYLFGRRVEVPGPGESTDDVGPGSLVIAPVVALAPLRVVPEVGAGLIHGVGGVTDKVVAVDRIVPRVDQPDPLALVRFNAVLSNRISVRTIKVDPVPSRTSMMASIDQAPRDVILPSILEMEPIDIVGNMDGAQNSFAATEQINTIVVRQGSDSLDGHPLSIFHENAGGKVRYPSVADGYIFSPRNPDADAAKRSLWPDPASPSRPLDGVSSQVQDYPFSFDDYPMAGAIQVRLERRVLSNGLAAA